MFRSSGTVVTVDDNVNDAASGVDQIKFLKTDDLIDGEKYRVIYMKKVNTKFGYKIRCFFDINTAYDLPNKFLIRFSQYDLDNDIDYRQLKLHYIGRADDIYKTIIINFEGLPNLPTEDKGPEQPGEAEQPENVPIQPDSEIEEGPENEPKIDKVVIEDLKSEKKLIMSNQRPTSSTRTIHRPDVFNSNPTKLGPQNYTFIKSIQCFDYPRYADLTTQEKSKKNSEDEERENICNICLENKVDACLYICGHKLCFFCSRRFLGGSCPFCRKRVKDAIKIFDC